MHSTDVINAPADASDDHQRAPGRACTICTHAERDAIEAALQQGESLRQVAVRFGVSTTAAHRHKAAHMAPAQQQAEPPASVLGAPEAAQATAETTTQAEPPAPPAAAASRVPRCSVCDLDVVARGAVDRALFHAPWNAAAIAERFKVQPAALDVHMRHMIQPAPPPAPPAPRPSYLPPPVALPATAAEARELLDRHGPSIVPKVIAWARAKYFWWCTSWAGPPGIKEVAYRGWMRALANAPNDSARLVACWKFSAELDRLAATDASVARAAAAHARFAVTAPASRFDVRGYLATLGTRGVQLRLDATDRVTSFPPGSLNEADRIIIAARRSEIAAFLQQPYEVV